MFKYLTLKCLGQAMVEYTIVTAAFVTGLLVLNNGACPDEYENCVEYLLTVMHDNSDGYSNSITAVQDYGKSYKPASGGGWPPPENPGGGGDPGGGGGGGSGTPSPEIQQVTQVTSADGSDIYGVLDGGNVVDPNGNILGVYDMGAGTFTPTVGVVVGGVKQKEVVQDEAGNTLAMQAVVDCVSGELQGFGYRSKTSGKFANSLNLGEVSISGFCLAPAYEVTSLSGGVDGGRIVNGKYYAVSISPGLAPTEPTGEVVYWSELNTCAVMVTEWDSGIDPDLDDDDRYDEQKKLFFEEDPNLNPHLGNMNALHYTEQIVLHGQPAWPNDCVSARTLP